MRPVLLFLFLLGGCFDLRGFYTSPPEDTTTPPAPTGPTSACTDCTSQVLTLTLSTGEATIASSGTAAVTYTTSVPATVSLLGATGFAGAASSGTLTVTSQQAACGAALLTVQASALGQTATQPLTLTVVDDFVLSAPSGPAIILRGGDARAETITLDTAPCSGNVVLSLQAPSGVTGTFAGDVLTLHAAASAATGAAVVSIVATAAYSHSAPLAIDVVSRISGNVVDNRGVPLASGDYSVSGGTIAPDGTFSMDTDGSMMIISVLPTSDPNPIAFGPLHVGQVTLQVVAPTGPTSYASVLPNRATLASLHTSGGVVPSAGDREQVTFVASENRSLGQTYVSLDDNAWTGAQVTNSATPFFDWLGAPTLAGTFYALQYAASLGSATSILRFGALPAVLQEGPNTIASIPLSVSTSAAQPVTLTTSPPPGYSITRHALYLVLGPRASMLLATSTGAPLTAPVPSVLPTGASFAASATVSGGPSGPVVTLYEAGHAINDVITLSAPTGFTLLPTPTGPTNIYAVNYAWPSAPQPAVYTVVFMHGAQRYCTLVTTDTSVHYPIYCHLFTSGDIITTTVWASPGYASVDEAVGAQGYLTDYEMLEHFAVAPLRSGRVVQSLPVNVTSQ